MVRHFKSIKGRNSRMNRHNSGRKTRSFKTRTSANSNANNSSELGILGAMLGASAFHDPHSAHDSNNAANDIDSIIGGGDKFTETGNKRVVGSRKSIDASYLILQFLEMLNTIKIFHWSTLSYPSHKATDELHSKMSDLVDSFIEQYIGGVGGGKTPVFKTRNIPFCCCKSIDMFRKKLAEYKTFLISLSDRLADVTELLNIRDEMLGSIDQTVYLLRLK
jgi:hypothetical protein